MAETVFEMLLTDRWECIDYNGTEMSFEGFSEMHACYLITITVFALNGPLGIFIIMC